MAYLEHTVHVDASWAILEAVSLNPDRLLEWAAGVTHVEPDGIFPESGGTLKLTYEAAGVTLHIDWMIVDREPGEYVLFRMAGMLEGISQWEISPEEGGTRLTCTYNYEIPWGAIDENGKRREVEQANAEMLAQSLNNLAALVVSEKLIHIRRL